MSINEMESKARELRQLQALIEEAQAEAEALKDALKTAMGDSESIQAGGIQNHMESCDLVQTGHRCPEEVPPRCGGAIYEADYHAPLLCDLKRKRGITAGRTVMPRP